MGSGFDEMRGAGNEVRAHYRGYDRWLAEQPPQFMRARREEAEVIFRRVGITFAVYGAKDEDGDGTERLIPFDLIPRVIPADEWSELEHGLAQRVTALNRFIHDVYHDQDDPQGRPRSLRAGPRQRPVPPGDEGRRRAGRRLLAHRRHRHRARRQCRRQRQLLRARGQPARAERRLVHAREPQDDDAALPRAVQPAPRRAGRPLPRPAARDAALGGAGGGERSDRGRADAGHVQQRLLRARLPGAADGHRAGRGAGPVRPRQLRLHAHDAGPEAGRRDLSPRRRRLPRPARVPRRLDARLRRPARRPTAPAT